jgi:hypothetical protein
MTRKTGLVKNGTGIPLGRAITCDSMSNEKSALRKSLCTTYQKKEENLSALKAICYISLTDIYLPFEVNIGSQYIFRGK